MNINNHSIKLQPYRISGGIKKSFYDSFSLLLITMNGAENSTGREPDVIERSLNNTETFQLSLTSLAFIALEFLLGKFPLEFKPLIIDDLIIEFNQEKIFFFCYEKKKMLYEVVKYMKIFSL